MNPLWYPVGFLGFCVVVWQLWKWIGVLFPTSADAHHSNSAAVLTNHYPTPHDIDPNPGFSRNVFRGTGSELVGLLIVAFCQKRGGWVAFSQEDIARLTMMCIEPGFRGLAMDALIVPYDDAGEYRVTEIFIRRLYEFYPAKKATA